MSDEKTEQPTQKRITDSRKKGQVANSKDVTSTALLISIFYYLGSFGGYLIDQMISLFSLPALFYTMPFQQAADQVYCGVVKVIIATTFPLMFIVMVVGVAANVAQVGFLMAYDSIMPNFEKLDPMAKLKNMFSVKNIVELLKSALKISFLTTLLYMMIRDLIDPMLKIPFSGVSAFLQSLKPVLKTFVYNVGSAYVVVAFIDLIFQRKNHIKELMMTKDEVKREYKESEGDPHIKGKRKQLQRELLSGDSPVAKTKKATVLVTNPTHYAVAILYDGGVETPLPVVLGKGSGELAQKMKEAAAEAGVPIMENVSLAQALFSLAEVDNYIPRDLIEPVAEVIRWVYEQRQNAQISS